MDIYAEDDDRALAKLVFEDDICVIAVRPDRTLEVVRGGAMSWEDAQEFRNFLVNDAEVRVWVEGFLHPRRGWVYRIVMRSPYERSDDRCGGA